MCVSVCVGGDKTLKVPQCVLLSPESIQGKAEALCIGNGTQHANCDFAFIVRKTQAS